MPNKIVFKEIEPKPIELKKNKTERVDTSVKGVRGAIGRLRWSGVSNGRYESKHPIYDKHDELAGYLVKGWDKLGYTYSSIYVDSAECFFVSSALRGESCGRISVVEPKGSFIFSPNETKFQRTATFSLPENLVSIYPAIRKVNETKNTIFCLNGYGFYFIDTLNRKLSYYKLFKYPNFDNCDYGISNDERLLATCLHESFQDPLEGASKYRYWLTVYNLSNGEELGEHILPSIEVINRTLSFNEDNSELSVISNSENYCFELKYAP